MNYKEFKDHAMNSKNPIKILIDVSQNYFVSYVVQKFPHKNTCGYPIYKKKRNCK